MIKKYYAACVMVGKDLGKKCFCDKGSIYHASMIFHETELDSFKEIDFKSQGLLPAILGFHHNPDKGKPKLISWLTAQEVADLKSVL